MLRATQLAAAVKNYFFDSYGHTSPAMNSNDCINQIYGVIQHRECELQVSNTDEIKQQLVKHWQSINTAFESHDFCVSVFPQIEQTY